MVFFLVSSINLVVQFVQFGFLSVFDCTLNICILILAHSHSFGKLFINSAIIQTDVLNVKKEFLAHFFSIGYTHSNVTVITIQNLKLYTINLINEIQFFNIIPFGAQKFICYSLHCTHLHVLQLLAHLSTLHINLNTSAIRYVTIIIIIIIKIIIIIIRTLVMR